ncbi:nucleotidyltransferase domain-containing protein [Polluticaenibacter yanchengensis]|uniref:Nucleotidyltransferase domain-containing protein n=1 Tax=Polluticaenibacter yanchengensis TaxID=3014562 RepID=A0ABT4UF00_9BACT|nr:nucleotidyltransferase domain-containing protein [Chitinophagaceae bacterium LY-5]
MKNKITTLLKNIAAKENITILYACESGSRAWGFPSTDSDYDIRIIYVREQSAYLNIHQKKDFFTYPITDNLDVYGWDLRKFLQLLYKSNCTPYEWLQSPIVYIKNDIFFDEMLAVLPMYFNCTQQLYHYKGIAYGSLKDDTIDSVGIKKLFYIVRPLLAALWIVKYRQYPPMHMDGLYKLLSGDLQRIFNDLIQKKAAAAERDILKIDIAVKAFVKDSFKELDLAIFENKSDISNEPLNQIFKKWIAK